MRKILDSPMKSYVLRQGRMTSAQRRALDCIWPKYGLAFTKQFIDLNQVFNREANCILEIGFGNGDSLLEQAVALPEYNFIGIEVYSPGVGRLLAGIERLGVSNLRVFQHDAIEVLSQCIPDNRLDKIQIFFPDPWPKKKHYKRRLVQPILIPLILRKLKQGGYLHCATDWEHYAQEMMTTLSTEHRLTNIAGTFTFHDNPYSFRTLTKFEQRGLKLQHTIRDLIFKKT